MNYIVKEDDKVICQTDDEEFAALCYGRKSQEIYKDVKPGQKKKLFFGHIPSGEYVSMSVELGRIWYELEIFVIGRGYQGYPTEGEALKFSQEDEAVKKLSDLRGDGTDLTTTHTLDEFRLVQVTSCGDRTPIRLL